MTNALMKFRVQAQLDEIRGADNRWFCSQAKGKEINDDKILVKHFVETGGAADFARRFDQAMGDDNRWFCSEFYDINIQDPEILWNYYRESGHLRSSSKSRQPNDCENECAAC